MKKDKKKRAPRRDAKTDDLARTRTRLLKADQAGGLPGL